jgi:hypothetical protein
MGLICDGIYGLHQPDKGRGGVARGYCVTEKIADVVTSQRN